MLENIENNFETSKSYYNQCMVDPQMQNKSLLSSAKLYIQTGDYTIGAKMYETLLTNENYNVLATIGLICLAVLQGDYELAYNWLMTLDKDSLTHKLLHYYNIMNIYILNSLGNLHTIENNFDPVKDYMTYRLFDNNEDILLSHIARHKKQYQRMTNGCFFKNIDLKALLQEARDRIIDMNGNHFEMSDMYRFRLDEPIGYKGDDITRDLCVVTMLGTKDIITMYPVSLSDEFDKEGLGTSKQLKYKREVGRIKND